MPTAQRWLVTGAGGQLGHDLQAHLQAAGADVTAVTRAELDIVDAAAVTAAFEAARPDVVVNAAAYTAVDAAETDEARALEVNGEGPRVLAAAAAAAGARLLHVSTDYVFDGTAAEPYRPDSPTSPRSAYGRTKLAGEHAVRETHPDGGSVVRTAWVYGRHGRNFVATMARLEREREKISVVDDQRGSPTWSRDLAAALVELGGADVPAGIFHATGAGDTTWCGFARAVFTALGADPTRVQAITSDQYPVPAPRPAYSVLSGEEWAAAGLTPLPDWRDALTRAEVPTWH